jgi:hypothetical protein
MLRAFVTTPDGRCFYRALLFLLLELGLVDAPPLGVDVLEGRDKVTLSYLMDWRQKILRIVQEDRAALRGDALVFFDEHICADLFDGTFVTTDKTRSCGFEGWLQAMLWDDTDLANVLVEAGTNYHVFAQAVARLYGIDIRVLSQGGIVDIAIVPGAGAMVVLKKTNDHFAPDNFFPYDELAALDKVKAPDKVRLCASCEERAGADGVDCLVLVCHRFPKGGKPLTQSHSRPTFPT